MDYFIDPMILANSSVLNDKMQLMVLFSSEYAIILRGRNKWPLLFSIIVS